MKLILPVVLAAEDYHQFDTFHDVLKCVCPGIKYIVPKNYQKEEFGAYKAVFFVEDCREEAVSIVRELDDPS